MLVGVAECLPLGILQVGSAQQMPTEASVAQCPSDCLLSEWAIAGLTCKWPFSDCRAGLQIVFSLKCGTPDMMSQLSLVTTWAMLVCALTYQSWTTAIRVACQGMKIVKCGELHSMWDYRKKQKKKIALLEKVGSNETGTGFLQEDTVPTGCAERSESVEMTHWSTLLQIKADGRD